MANTNLIYTYIQDSGYKLQYVASVLHISSMSVRIGSMGRLANAMLTAVTHSVTVVSLLQRKMKINTSVAAHMNAVFTHATVMSLKMV